MERKNSRESDKVVAWVVGAVILLGGVFYIWAQAKSPSEPNAETSVVGTKEQTKDIASEDAAEKECQEVATIKTKDRDISVIDVWNYKPQYSDNGDGSYTLTWNGSQDDTVVPFVCDVVVEGESLQVERLSMGDELLQ